ncbi:MAG: c-type cytochrome [Planctomycetales bacterium]|nr:c-type cytochrome [Planctomycetales bacterium]
MNENTKPRTAPFFLLLALLYFPPALCAEEPSIPLPDKFPRVPPKEPAEAIKTFECQQGFSMQLVAAEPLVMDPVDMAYDEDGRGYVVEMRDYPFPEEKNAEPKVFLGQVRLLVDDDGDGRMDRSTVFADQLAWPTSVCCWKGGVFVAAAPDIWYFKDTDGDGKADVRRKVFTGFSRYNVQAIMNNMKWGLDHRIYGSAAGNGGIVKQAGEEHAGEKGVSLARRDFRFDPVTEKLEATSGGERYGNCFDDWGNRFLCNIRNPVQHVVLPAHYLARNPHLVVPRTVNDVAESGDQLRVYRISEPEAWRTYRAQRWSLDRVNFPRSELIGAGFWTSSSGATVYRGGAYGDAFRDNVFIGEVAGNLVHRQILTRDGVTFKSRRADPDTEFVRSTDNWFRPVNFVNAPDGCLHVLDMYRETIEHPWSIPDDIKAKLDLSSGNDRGRIWRLTPPGFDLAKTMPKFPKLSKATTEELVAILESPHSWWRETAHRLIYERQEKSAAGPLRRLLKESKWPQAKLHALWSLEGLGVMSRDDIRNGLSDHPLEIVRENAEVIRHAIVLRETLKPTDYLPFTDSDRLENFHLPFIRFQKALSAGTIDDPSQIETLADIARFDAGDPWVRAAILSSTSKTGHLVVENLFSNQRFLDPVGGSELIRELAFTVGARGDAAQLRLLVETIARKQEDGPVYLPYAAIAGLARGCKTRRQTLTSLLDKSDEKVRSRITELMNGAIVRVSDTTREVVERVPAMELFPFFPWDQVSTPLFAALSPQEPREVQRTALKVLASRDEKEVASELISRWKQLTPPVREEGMTILLSRPDWLPLVVEALEQGNIPAGQLSIPHRARILLAADKALVARAEKILGPAASSPRKEIVEKYRQALAKLAEAKTPADATKGSVVYRRECANCHQLGKEGFAVGPNLATIRHRSPQEILIHVLDPNREVSPDFVEYSVLLTDGRTLTGLIANETDAGLTLRRSEGKEDSILRREIEQISSSGKSLMPEGVEQKVTPAEMADLVAFLLGSK